MGRTNIAVTEEVAATLAEQAKKENKSLYALANECLQASLKITKYGGRTSEIHPAWLFAHFLKDLGTPFVPGELIDKMVQKLQVTEPEWLLKAWHDAGSKMGLYFQLHYPLTEDLYLAIQDLQDVIPLRRFELKQTQEGGQTRFIVTLVSGYSQEFIACLEQLIRGLIEAYPLMTVNSRIAEGIVELTAIQTSRVVRTEAPAR